MLKGYENINFELCEDDLEWIGPFSKALTFAPGVYIALRRGRSTSLATLVITDSELIYNLSTHK